MCVYNIRVCGNVSFYGYIYLENTHRVCKPLDSVLHYITYNVFFSNLMRVVELCIFVCMYGYIYMQVYTFWLYSMSCGSDDDNRIQLTELPSEMTGEEDGGDYVNAYMGDYINASYIDVRVTTCEMCG